LVIAHRGLPKQYQENTYDSIINSLHSNADGFELDIYKTKDDKLVVFHDDNTKVRPLDRMKRIFIFSKYRVVQKKYYWRQ